MKNGSALITAFCAGIVAGSAVAFFVAPKSGEELRADLVDKVNQIIERGKLKSKEIADQVTHAGDQVQRELQRRYTAVIQALDDLVEAVGLKAA